MKLGGPLFHPFDDPESWVAACRRHGYTAAACPVDHDAPEDEVRAYARAAEEAGIVIAEVGAWSNPIGPNETERNAALELCKARLDLADRIGARCCVNIAGSRGAIWDGPHPDNLTRETYDLIVETVRNIIDTVKPTRSFYTLETMPWVPPDSPKSYADLVRDIDRPQFGVHFDPVNLVNSPARYYRNGDMIREAFRLLGPKIKSCHAKDITLASRLTVHLEETVPGRGNLDYRAFLTELDRLPPDTPLLMEHMASEEEYAEAAGHIRSVAAQEGIRIG